MPCTLREDKEFSDLLIRSSHGCSLRFLIYVIFLYSTRFCETCRWDVPAAAVIHPHNLLLRLRFLRFSVFRLLMFLLFLWLHLFRSTQFLLYCLNVHFYVHDVYVLHLHLFDLDFTLLCFYLCLSSFVLHTALLFDWDIILIYFAGIVAHYCLELTKSVVTVTS